MRIDGDLQPMGPERMMQRLQEFQAMFGGGAPAFQVAGGVSGLSGNLPATSDGFAPFDPKSVGVSIKADAAPANLKNLIEKAANENGIDPALLDAIVAVESNYDTRARSGAGALGLTQLMPTNIKELGITDAFDPEQNLQGGARQLSQLMARYHGKLDLVLAAYNAGPTAVDQAGGRIPNYAETQKYVRKVTDLYNLRRAQP